MNRQQKNVVRFVRLTNRRHIFLEQMAKRMGISSSALVVTKELLDAMPEGTTQKAVCAITGLSKQTVHSIIRRFEREGKVILLEQKQDKREKCVRYTETGLAFAKQACEPVIQIENEAMNAMTPEEQEEMLRLVGIYSGRLYASLGTDESK